MKCCGVQFAVSHTIYFVYKQKIYPLQANSIFSKKIMPNGFVGDVKYVRYVGNPVILSTILIHMKTPPSVQILLKRVALVAINQIILHTKENDLSVRSVVAYFIQIVCNYHSRKLSKLKEING